MISHDEWQRIRQEWYQRIHDAEYKTGQITINIYEDIANAWKKGFEKGFNYGNNN